MTETIQQTMETLLANATPTEILAALEIAVLKAGSDRAHNKTASALSRTKTEICGLWE